MLKSVKRAWIFHLPLEKQESREVLQRRILKGRRIELFNYIKDVSFDDNVTC